MLKRWMPVIVASAAVALGAWWVLTQEPAAQPQVKPPSTYVDAPIVPQRSCARYPAFLRQKGIPVPVMIDLSQRRYKGAALLYGRGFSQAYHPDEWARFGHMGTYTLDKAGNIYLAPMPYVSIKEDTFRRQQALYRIDTQTGKLTEWLRRNEIAPGAHNPYGFISVVYDCDDHTLWASALDGSDYESEKGRIYHIDVATKKVLRVYEHIDALTFALGYLHGKKVLVIGSAREPKVEILRTQDGARFVLGELPNGQLRVRKIRLKSPTRMLLESVRFSYALVVETSHGEERTLYDAIFDPSSKRWRVQSR